MQKIIKNILNIPLAPLNLKIHPVRQKKVSGIYLWDDIRYLVDNESPVCFDVGANVGQTIQSLLRTFREPKIYSFEPSGKTYRALKDRANNKKQVFLYNYALGSTCEEREFINYENSTLSSFLALDSSSEHGFRDKPELNREVVKTETLDRFIAAEKIDKIDLLKIDTQGFDLDVLQGAEQALSDELVSNVLVELNFIKMYQGQSSAEEINTYLNKYGFFLVDYYEKVRRSNTIGWCTALFSRR